MRIVKSIFFDAAHFLDQGDAVDPETRPYARMHGHSFTLEVEIEGAPDENTGWVVDFADVADALEPIREMLDHRLLNEVPGLERPTLENICRWVADRLQKDFPGLRTVSVARASNGERCIYEVSS
ncbi:MAG: 6-carboxytetrahydropterin synthase QueD [Pseudomonadota bacterium]